jgi:lysozyme
MKTSKRGIGLIKEFEGCRLMPYQDAVAIWTVGYGHTGDDVRPGIKITQAKADALLVQDLARFERGIERIFPEVPLNQDQFDALVAFAFNIGLRALERSTLARKLKAGDIKGASEQFLRWTKAGGKELKGLVRRRIAERDLFLSKGTNEGHHCG